MQADFFTYDEFSCKCGCGLQKIQDELLEKIDMARFMLGLPMTITSGMRCTGHNKLIGGSETSSHLKGWAADVQCITGRSHWDMFEAFKNAGFTRIGIAKSFIHVDCDPTKKGDLIWVY